MIVSGADPSPWRPLPISASSSQSSAKETGNDAQWSMTPAWRIFSPSRRVPGRAPRSASCAFQASMWCSPGVKKNGTELASSRWSKSPAACSTIHSHSPAEIILRSGGSSSRPARESMTSSRESPRSR